MNQLRVDELIALREQVKQLKKENAALRDRLQVEMLKRHLEEKGRKGKK